jgi:hypothetical protein
MCQLRNVKQRTLSRRRIVFGEGQPDENRALANPITREVNGRY